MNLEIHKPELAQRMQARIQSGHFHDTDELIEKALDALDIQVAAATPLATGAVVLAATALHHGLTIVTRDRSDFDKAGVSVFNPWEQ